MEVHVAGTVAPTLVDAQTKLVTVRETGSDAGHLVPVATGSLVTLSTGRADDIGIDHVLVRGDSERPAAVAREGGRDWLASDGRIHPVGRVGACRTFHRCVESKRNFGFARGRTRGMLRACLGGAHAV